MQHTAKDPLHVLRYLYTHTFSHTRTLTGNLPQTPPIDDKQLREFFDQAMRQAGQTSIILALSLSLSETRISLSVSLLFPLSSFFSLSLSLSLLCSLSLSLSLFLTQYSVSCQYLQAEHSIRLTFTNIQYMH